MIVIDNGVNPMYACAYLTDVKANPAHYEQAVCGTIRHVELCHRGGRNRVVYADWQEHPTKDGASVLVMFEPNR